MPVAESTHTEVGAFEAKTKLSEILRRVEQGERFTITRNGRAIADLRPTEDKAGNDDAALAAEELRHFPRVQGVSGETVLDWIREGRKY